MNPAAASAASMTPDGSGTVEPMVGEERSLPLKSDGAIAPRESIVGALNGRLKSPAARYERKESVDEAPAESLAEATAPVPTPDAWMVSFPGLPAVPPITSAP